MSDEKARIVATYTAAADRYDEGCAAFWGWFGRRTVARLSLPAGARVLDACCGTGAAALPAAEIVGPRGLVLGLDLTPALLAKAESRARERGFDHLRFVCADLESVTLPDAPFDAVTCVFGIFFLPDMRAALRRLWEWVRPGGVLAVTTWGRTVLEPVTRHFWDAVREECPDLHTEFRPWDRIATPADLVTLFEAAGIPAAHAETERRTFDVPDIQDFWSMVLGSGYRGTLEQVDAEGRERLRRRVLDALRRHGARALEMEVLYGSARKGETR
jgi:ubiquinone/menaquinone biosynthesis C-methylase UbiE